MNRTPAAIVGGPSIQAQGVIDCAGEQQPQQPSPVEELASCAEGFALGLVSLVTSTGECTQNWEFVDIGFIEGEFSMSASHSGPTIMAIGSEGVASLQTWTKRTLGIETYNNEWDYEGVGPSAASHRRSERSATNGSTIVTALFRR